MRIAILTYHRAYNCGAMLQAWALKSVLERMGHTVEFPACNHVGEYSRWKNIIPRNVSLLKKLYVLGVSPLIYAGSFGVASQSIAGFVKFREKFLPERVCAPSEFTKYYDLVIVGSDQVWCERHSGDDAPLFMGKGIDSTLPMISYAASYGDSFLNRDAAIKLAEYLNRYTALSARENIVRTQMKEFGFDDIEVVADPTLLLGKTDYDAISTEPDMDGDILYCYSVSMSRKLMERVRQIAKAVNVKSIVTPNFIYSRFGAGRGVTFGVSPDKMIGFMKRAKYVVASSFHGTALAIVHEKPVISLRNNIDKYESRPASLLNRLGMGDRIMHIDAPISDMIDKLQASYPINAKNDLNAFRAHSIDWLKSSIGKI